MSARIFLLLVLTVLFGCNGEKSFKFKTVISKNIYSLEVPDFMTESKILHEEASLQYQNLFREFYMVVIDEPIEEFNALIEMEAFLAESYTPNLTGYANLLIDNMESAVDDSEVSEVQDIKINGLPARYFQLTGTVEGIDIFYQIAYLQGKEKYYQLVVWTEQKSKEKYAPAMEKIIMSFKELN